MRHSLPVLVVRRPHGDLVTFGADVDHGAANVVTVVVEGLAHKAEELEGAEGRRKAEGEGGASSKTLCLIKLHCVKMPLCAVQAIMLFIIRNVTTIPE